MANLVLTHACNKGCSYCFARDVRSEELKLNNNIHMSLELIEDIIGKVAASTPPGQIPHFKLLGGEPTQHPEFGKILELVYSKRAQITLISNFLFNEEILDIVIKYTKLGVINGFLINATELDVKDRMTVFSRNYNTLYENLYKENKEMMMGLGITLDHTLTAEYYIEYLDFLNANLTAIESFRVSINFPGQGEKKENFFFINNHELGLLLIRVVKKIKDLDIPAHLDCINFPCMYGTKEEKKFIDKFLDGSQKYVCGDRSGPTDYMPDGTAIYCYPNHLVSTKIKHFKSDEGVAEALRMKYQINKSMVTMPDACLKCPYYRNGCEGPCLGFFDLSKFED